MTELGAEQQQFSLRLERVFDAPAEVVFDAWTNPEVMRRWLHAGPDWTTPVAEADVRPGGNYRLVMVNPEGEEHGASGSYIVVERPQRLSFSWIWEEAQVDSVVELEFEQLGEQTKVILTHSRLASEESRDRHIGGWEGVLDNLALELGV